MAILSNKLQLLKRDLKDWNKHTFGNITKNVKVEEEKLIIFQNNIQVDGLNDSLKFR